MPEKLPVLMCFCLFSATYEVTEDQVFAGLQNIFVVKLPNAAAATGQNASSFMDLPDTSNMIAMRNEGAAKDSSDGETGFRTIDEYKELASDILTEVIMNMSTGKLRDIIYTIGRRWRY